MAAIGQAQLKKLDLFNLKRNIGIRKYLNGIRIVKILNLFLKNLLME